MPQALPVELDALPCPAWICAPATGRLLDANPAAANLFGWRREDFAGKTLSELLPDDGGRAALDGDGACACRLLTRDGLRWTEILSRSLPCADGAVRLMLAIDREPESQLRQRLAETQAQLQEIKDIARLGTWELDPDTGGIRYSDEFFRILARNPPERRQWLHIDELLSAAGDAHTRARIERKFAELRAGEPSRFDVLVPLIASDGSPRTLHLRGGSAAAAADGRRRIHGTFQDVTEREESRQLLREREAQFRELVRVMPDGVMILAQERVLYANAACSAQFGYADHAVLGEPLEALVAEADYPRALEQLRGAAHEAATATLRMRRRDGSGFRAGLTVGDVRYGGRDCKLLVVRDLSEPERMRDALAVSNGELQALAKRLFSLQEDERRAISRDLHDDVGQAITAMKLSAHAAMAEPDEAARREELQEIVVLADATIAKLRNLSMLLRPPQLDELGLEAALRWQASALFRASPVRLRLDIRPLPGRPGHEVEQACFRIAQESLTNALRHACAGEVALTLRPDGERRLFLEVADDGDGFELGAPGGLGLIVMRERAQGAGGSLRIASAPGAGTRVEVRLPYHAGDGPARDEDGN